MLGLRLRRLLWRWKSQPHSQLAQTWLEAPSLLGVAVIDARFLVVDAEMSGLDPAGAELLSLGWVAVESAEICLDTARHIPIKNTASVGQSAAIHHLRDCELVDAAGVEDALLALVEAARGRVLVFHHAELDLAFLNRAARECMKAPLLLPAVDTMLQELKLMRRRDVSPAQGDLRLQSCRDRYGLTAHAAHNALSDALATAELFLAQLATRGSGLRLRDLN
ncbi:MAG: exonuclease domain-containing protein [Congregibacter sp.]